MVQDPSKDPGHNASCLQISPSPPAKSENSNYKPAIYSFGEIVSLRTPEYAFTFETRSFLNPTGPSAQSGFLDMAQPQFVSTAKESNSSRPARPSFGVKHHSADSSYHPSQQGSSSTPRSDMRDAILQSVVPTDHSAQMRPFDELVDKKHSRLGFQNRPQ